LLKQFSLAEKLVKKISHRERVVAQTYNFHELRHYHFILDD
jgi:hypothetical protein